MNRMQKATVAALLVLTLGSAAAAQIKKATIKVDGLACPFCAYSLEKGLKRAPGVADVKVYVDDGRAELMVKAGQSIDFDALEEAVRKGGYTPRDIYIEAAGRIEQWNGRPAFVIPENDVKLLLADNENLQKLNRSAQGRSVTIAGKLQKQEPGGHHGHPHMLVIERFEIN